MFSRCASGSCDFVLFSVDDRACIVEDIILDRELDGVARDKLDNLAKGLNFDCSILEKCKSRNVYSNTI